MNSYRRILALSLAATLAALAAPMTVTAADEAASAEVRVTHVPEFIQEQIREEVRRELRAQVAADVAEQARKEGWLLPGALPQWMHRLSWSGDLRLRAQGDRFADDNIGLPNGYFDFNEINDAGGFGRTDQPFLNTTEDRQRLRVRARLGLNVRVAESPVSALDAGLRLSTGGSDPVSTNQTLGNGFGRSSVSWDQMYLRYRRGVDRSEPWLTAWGGRIPNPWLSTDLVWDSDLAFEGVAARFAYDMAGTRSEGGVVRNVFLTLGAFPLEEIERSSKDKWLYGAQLGVDIGAREGSRFRFGAAYYVYENISGRRNTLGSTLNDFTAPAYMQKGNLLFDIRNDDDTNTDFWALAADYRLLNLTAEYDIVPRDSMHVVLTADYVKNVGYDEDKIRARTGGAVVARSQGFPAGTDPIEARDQGYLFKLALGYPDRRTRGAWQVFTGYRHLERDAVLDAYTDSDFHLGGTDNKGWFIGGEYAFMNNAWLTARWLSADSIDGAPMGVDVAQIDLNVRF